VNTNSYITYSYSVKIDYASNDASKFGLTKIFPQQNFPDLQYANQNVFVETSKCIFHVHIRIEILEGGFQFGQVVIEDQKRSQPAIKHHDICKFILILSPAQRLVN